MESLFLMYFIRTFIYRGLCSRLETSTLLEAAVPRHRAPGPRGDPSLNSTKLVNHVI